ncbi:MAG: class I SAM-dependent methyltransferase [Ancalomicrobiaceae bacterium]|nr:class I SAM-dependent methyltransferase [Ancalomicrobiaceae bacterium]
MTGSPTATMGMERQSGRRRMGLCPVCRATGEHEVELTARAASGAAFDYVRCASCRSLYVPDFTPPAYERAADSIEAADLDIKFYVEQGAGLETLVTPAMIGRRRAGDRYLEIGCGFGFGLDFASRSMGWEVRGVDPGRLAKAGRQLLGLDIEHRYLSAEDDFGGGFDTIAAIEVIEHFVDPADLLAIVRKALAKGGLAYLTTPNAGCTEAGRPTVSLLSALSPGNHAFLLSKAGLEAALARAGIADYAIREQDRSLDAVIGADARLIDPAACFDDALYEAYLEARTREPSASPFLQIGFAYRLFKFLVNHNRLDEARGAFERIEQMVRRCYDLNLSDVWGLLRRLTFSGDRIRLFKTFPFCLTGIYFFAGIMTLNGSGDATRAADFFFAAMRVAMVVRKALLSAGIDDGELDDLQQVARRHVVMLLGPDSRWTLA